MHISTVIQQLGYKKNEAKVYLTALSMGESTVSSISKRLKLPRTSVQAIIESLHDQGLMNIYAKRRYKYWVAENPERLMISLKEREAALKQIMPELSTLRHTGGGKPTVKVFNGTEDIKLIHDDIISTKQNLSAIIPWDRWSNLFEKGYVQDFSERRARVFLKSRILVPKTEEAFKLQARDEKELRQTKFLYNNVDMNACIFIYGNKVAIITLNSWQPMGIVIDDLSVKEMQLNFFNVLWSDSK